MKPASCLVHGVGQRLARVGARSGLVSKSIPNQMATQRFILAPLLVALFATPMSATLIVFAPYRGGAAVCADRRTFDRVRGDRDDKIKVFRIDPRTAYVATGSMRFVNPVNFTESWNVDRVVQDFYSTRSFTGAAMNDLFSAVDNSFRSYLSRIPKTSWPSAPNSFDDGLFLVMFFRVRPNGAIEASGFRFLYSNMPSLSTQASLIHPAQQQAMGLGNIAVWNELASGTDSRFASFRNEDLIRRYVIEKWSSSTLTVEDAVKFARRMIVITSEYTNLLESSTNHVGPTSDCVQLDSKSGFNWVPAEKPRVKPDAGRSRVGN